MDKSAAKVLGTDWAMGVTSGSLVTVSVLLSLGCASLAQKEVMRELSGARGRVSVAVAQLGSAAGAEETDGWNIGGAEPFAAGETVAVFVLTELFRQVEDGKVSLDERIEVDCETRDDVSSPATRPGLLASLRSVGEISLRDLAVLALAYGDATAVNLLIDRLGLQNINDTARALGAKGTRIERKLGYRAPPENYTTANDLIAVWSNLAYGDAYTARTRESIEDLLRASRNPIRHLGPELAASDVRVSLDGDSPGRAVTVHASGVLYLPSEKLALAVMGEQFDNQRYGQDLAFRVAQIVYTCHGKEVCRAAR